MKRKLIRPSGRKSRRNVLGSAAREVKIEGLEERRLLAFCVTTTADDGAGSLRQAIMDANANAGADEIDFQIPSGDLDATGTAKIELESELPAITDALVIDGTTQPGYEDLGRPVIWIDGSNGLGVDACGHPGQIWTGLQVQGGNSTIRGLAMTGFRAAISLTDGAADTVKGNYIGFDPTAEVPDFGHGNTKFGIEVKNAGSIIGGTGANEANVISFNDNEGIRVSGSGASIVGNRIGTDPTSQLAMSNGTFGIHLRGASNITISQNVISNNFDDGIHIERSTAVQILGNKIGTDDSGTEQFVGNQGDGIEIANVAASAGSTPQILIDGNLIASNLGDGIRLKDANDVTITDNVIGYDTDDSDLGLIFGNNGDGIGLESASSSNQIGKIPPGEGNTIAYNLGAGVAIYAQSDLTQSGVRNSVRGNSIHDNNSVGIDLGERGHLDPDLDFDVLGPTPNDSAGHAGPNNYQVFPVLAPATRNGNTVILHGSITAAPHSEYSIDLFANRYASLTGYGEGEIYLTTVTVHTNASGVATFNVSQPGLSTEYTAFTATATDADGNTSEFSQVPTSVTLNSTTTLDSSANPATYGDTVTFTATVTGDGVTAPTGEVTFMEGDDVLGTGTVNASGIATFSISSLAAGHHNITAVYGGDDAYVSSTSAALDENVLAKALTITVNDATKVYGSADPAFSVSYSCFANSEAASVLSGHLNFATTGSHVGAHAISASGLSSSNYAITYVDGTLTITKASLVITADDKSKTYGANNPTLTASYSGFVNGDNRANLTNDVILATSATSASNVGAYAITASAALSDDYAISFVAGTLTINKAALTITANNATKTYVATNPPLSASYSGFVNGDTAASLSTGVTLQTGANAASHVGSYAIVASGAVAANYSITYVNGSLAVTPAALTVKVANATKIYGQANPSFTLQYTGLQNGDVAASLSGVPLFLASADASTGVGSYAVTVGGLTSADYAITFQAGTLNITPAALTIAVNDVTRAYGQANPSFTLSYTGLVNGDLSTVVTGTPVFSTVATPASPAGDYAVTVSGLSAANYTITYLPGDLTVLAGLTISGTVLVDNTGNGLSDDDTTPIAGVTVKLYADSDHNGALSSGDQVVTQMATGSNGAYSFAAQPGVYFVSEVTPGGYLQTGPAVPLYYTVSGTNGGNSAGNDFDNYMTECDCSDVTNVSYLINGTTIVDNLRGSVHQGDTVQVIFTIRPGEQPHLYSFVSYSAPGSTFDADNAHQQMVYDSDSGVFGPGVHTLTVTAPDCYFQVDFVCGAIIDHLGAAGSNIFYTPQGRLIGADNGGTQCSLNAPSSISGFVYLDANNNGSIDMVDGAIAGVKVVLSGTDDRGKSVSMVEFSDADGRYFFGGLRPGTYCITETQPTGVSDGRETLGSIAGSSSSTFGSASNNRFSNIKLAANRDGINYNFGETGSTVRCGQAATIGFWQNSSGQSLLKCLNNGSSDTNLGIWLAANFPNLYGANAGTNSLLGKTNAQIASYYSTLYKTTAQKLDAQVLALAFASYVTDSGLAGTVARNYGFVVSDTGVGSATFNVGSNGAAFGVNNNSTVAVSALLQIADNRSWNGTLWDVDHSGTLSGTEQSWRNMAINIFNAINNAGGV